MRAREIFGQPSLEALAWSTPSEQLPMSPEAATLGLQLSEAVGFLLDSRRDYPVCDRKHHSVEHPCYECFQDAEIDRHLGEYFAEIVKTQGRIQYLKRRALALQILGGYKEKKSDVDT